MTRSHKHQNLLSLLILLIYWTSDMLAYYHPIIIYSTDSFWIEIVLMQEILWLSIFGQFIFFAGFFFLSTAVFIGLCSVEQWK